MKKFLKILGFTILGIFILLLVLPFLFKGKIVEEIQKAANENLNAQVAFEDVSLSLITNFPNLSVDFNEFTVKGVDQFEGVTLADIKTFSATVDVKSLFGDKIEIVEIGITEPIVHVLVLEDGSANYDIMKASEEEEVETPEAEEEGEGIKMGLQNYFLKDGHIIYDDRSMPYFMELVNLNHEGSGNFEEDVFTLLTQTHADEVNVVYDGVTYVNKVTADIDADIDMNFNEMKFTFKENEVKINELVLGADGWLAMPEDDIDMDITYYAKETQFRNLLSMVPAEFASDLEEVDVTGTMALQGYVKGTYNENSMPGFGVEMQVENGRFQYPDLPKAAENIQIDVNIDAPDGNDYDKMTIDMPIFHVELGGNPIDANLKLRTPMSDPQIDTEIQAKIVLATLKDVIPMEETDNLNGSINADVSIHGRMSTIEQEQYEQFDAKGQIILQEIVYTSEEMAYDVNLDVAYFNFSPQYLELSQFKSRIADSDISANGKITNYLAYALKDSLLTGNFEVNSNLLNLNPLMASEEGEEETTEEAPADTVAMSVMEVPENIDFTMNADFKKVIYENVEIDNMAGQIEVKDKKAILTNLGMNLLGGNVNMNGVYDTQNPVRPTVDFQYDINSLDIQETATTFNTVEKLAPIAKNATGKFSTDMTFRAALDTTMSPINESIEGQGTLQTESVYIEGFEPLNELAAKLNIDRLAKQNIEDVTINYKFENGRVTVDPFEMELEGMEATVSGYTTFEQEIDYQLAMEVPYEKLGDNIGQQASSLMGQINDKLGTNLSAGQTIPVKVDIVGTVTDPKLQLNFGSIGGSAKDIKEEVKEQVKEKVEEKVEEVKEDAVEKAREEADKILADAQKKADKLVEEAEKTAEDVREEGYAQAQKLEDEANNPLKKAGAKIAADKLRKETDKKADQIVSEAEKQAANIMQKANDRADKLIEEAKKK